MLSTSSSKEAYLSEIKNLHDQNITNPAAVLKALLLQYNPNQEGYWNPAPSHRDEYFQDHVLHAFFATNVEQHNKLLSGKLIRLLDHPSESDHVLSVIDRLNSYVASDKVKLVDASLIDLLSSFFTVYDQYSQLRKKNEKTFFSDALKSVLSLSSWETYEKKYCQYIFDELALEDEDYQTKITAARILVDVNQFGSGEKQDKIIKYLLKKFLQESKYFENQSCAIDVLQKLQPVLGTHLPAYIEGLKKILLTTRIEDGQKLFASKALSLLAKHISPEDQTDLIKQITKNPQLMIDEVKSLTYLVDFVPEDAADKISTLLMDAFKVFIPLTKDQPQSLIFILQAISNFRSLFNKDQKVELIHLMTDCFSNAPLDSKKILCNGFVFLQGLVDKNLYLPLITELINSIDYVNESDMYGCKAEACASLNALFPYIPVDKTSSLINKLLQVIEAKFYFGISANAFALLLRLKTYMDPQQLEWFASILTNIKTAIASNQFNEDYAKMFLQAKSYYDVAEQSALFKEMQKLLFSRLTSSDGVMVLQITKFLNYFVHALPREQKFSCSLELVHHINRMARYQALAKKNCVHALKSIVADLTASERNILMNKLVKAIDTSNEGFVNFDALVAFVEIFKVHKLNMISGMSIQSDDMMVDLPEEIQQNIMRLGLK